MGQAQSAVTHHSDSQPAIARRVTRLSLRPKAQSADPGGANPPYGLEIALEPFDMAVALALSKICEAWRAHYKRQARLCAFCHMILDQNEGRFNFAHVAANFVNCGPDVQQVIENESFVLGHGKTLARHGRACPGHLA